MSSKTGTKVKADTLETSTERQEGENIFNLLPAKQGNFSNVTELNKAVKRNLNVRTNRELSRKILSIYNFLSSLEPDNIDAVNYTSIITGAITLYYDKLQTEYKELFSNYEVTVGTGTAGQHHKAITELLNLINEE